MLLDEKKDFLLDFKARKGSKEEIVRIFDDIDSQFKFTSAKIDLSEKQIFN